MIFRVSCGVVDLERRLVHREGRDIELTPTEVSTLAYLHARAGKVVPREELLSAVWGYSARSRSQAIHVAIRRLRSKIERDPGAPEHLKTVASVGWVLEPAPAPRIQEKEPNLLGRDGLIEDLLDTLRERRLLALIGPGGIGKSSLARSLVRRLGGVFVDLSSVARRAEVEAAVARALGVDHADRAIAAQSLVALDNLEQLQDKAIEPIARWASLGARLLLTSRVSSALSALPGLERVEVEGLSPEHASELLVRRALSLGVDDLDPQDPDIARLVEALERNPLQIALAAPRLKVLSPRAILERIEDRFAVLKTRAHGLDQRHVALEVSLEASWQLLDEPARSALVDLTLFRAPISMGAAEAVLGDGALDLLQALLDASLARREKDRISLYASVRAFAARREPSLGAIAGFGRWYASLDPNKVDPLDIPDLCAALRRAIDARDAEIAVPCARSLGSAARRSCVPEAVGLLDEAIPLASGTRRATLARLRAAAAAYGGDVEGALVSIAELAPEDPLERGMLEELRSNLLVRLSRLEEASAAIESAMCAFDLAGRPQNQVTSRINAGALLGRLGQRDRAIALLEAAQARARALSEPHLEAGALSNLAGLLAPRPEAAALMREAIALLDRVGDAYGASEVRLNLAQIALLQGDLRGADELAVRALDRAGALNVRLRSRGLAVRGVVARRQGDREEARRFLLEAAEGAERAADARLLAVTRRHLAGLLRDDGEIERARAMFSLAESALLALGEQAEVEALRAEREGA